MAGTAVPCLAEFSEIIRAKLQEQLKTAGVGSAWGSRVPAMLMAPLSPEQASE